MGPMAVERVVVGIAGGPDTDSEEFTLLSRRLRAELAQLDVESVDYATDSPPSGAKTGTAVDLSTLIVTLSDSTVLAALVGLLRTWVRRGRGREVTIQLGEDKVEIKGELAGREAELINKWLDQHAKK